MTHAEAGRLGGLKKKGNGGGFGTHGAKKMSPKLESYAIMIRGGVMKAKKAKLAKEKKLAKGNPVRGGAMSKALTDASRNGFVNGKKASKI